MSQSLIDGKLSIRRSPFAELPGAGFADVTPATIATTSTGGFSTKQEVGLSHKLSAELRKVSRASARTKVCLGCSFGQALRRAMTPKNAAMASSTVARRPSSRTASLLAG